MLRRELLALAAAPLAASAALTPARRPDLDALEFCKRERARVNPTRRHPHSQLEAPGLVLADTGKFYLIASVTRERNYGAWSRFFPAQPSQDVDFYAKDGSKQGQLRQIRYGPGSPNANSLRKWAVNFGALERDKLLHYDGTPAEFDALMARALEVWNNY